MDFIVTFCVQLSANSEGLGTSFIYIQLLVIYYITYHAVQLMSGLLLNMSKSDRICVNDSFASGLFYEHLFYENNFLSPRSYTLIHLCPYGLPVLFHPSVRFTCLHELSLSSSQEKSGENKLASPALAIAKSRL